MMVQNHTLSKTENRAGYNEGMERIADRLSDEGFSVLLWKNKHGRPPVEHPLSKTPPDVLPVAGIDVGLNIGIAILSSTGLLLAWKKTKDLLDAADCTVRVVKILSPGIKTWCVEQGYCPAHAPVFLSGIAAGAIISFEGTVALIPPHKKPPVRKVKSMRMKVDAFVQWANQVFSPVLEDVPTGFSHAVSAFGCIEAYLEELNAAAVY